MDITLSLQRLNPGGAPIPDTARIIRAYKLRQLTDAPEA